MTTSSISFIGPETTIGELAGTKSDIYTSSFANWLTQKMDAVNTQIQHSEMQVRQLVAGEEDNLHQIMMSLEKAKLEFELVLQVRNRLLESYQEIMRMQV